MFFFWNFEFQEVFQHPTGLSIDPNVVMEGYLFKRATNAFKTWNRRWFMIKDDKLVGYLTQPEQLKPKELKRGRTILRKVFCVHRIE